MNNKSAPEYNPKYNRRGKSPWVAGYDPWRDGYCMEGYPISFLFPKLFADVIRQLQDERTAVVVAATREGMKRWGKRPQPYRREPAADPQDAHFYLYDLNAAFAAIVLDAWREQHR